MNLTTIKNDCNNLSKIEKEDLIKYLTLDIGGKYENHFQSNCKHYNTTWIPREQKYRCRNCNKLGVSTENDRWK